MNLGQLLNSVDVIHVSGSAETKEIESIEIDSRKVKEKSIFVAIKGFNVDGHDYIPEAISRGAAAVVIEDDSKVPGELFIVNDTVKIVVQNSRKALSQLSNNLYGNPSSKLKLIGVTGTKGKTTTTFFIKNIIETAGKKCGLIGTNKYIVGNKEYVADRTTPEAHVINKLLAEMISEGCEYAVMEVSSHSIELLRVDDLNFHTAIFTNITSDHLDYHKTFEAYREAKSKLFSKLSPEANAVVNGDDTNWKFMIADSDANTIVFGANQQFNYVIKNVQFNLDGTRWEIEHNNSTVELRTDLIGKFNAYNATAAFCACVESGIPVDIVQKGIASMPQVPGRFEVLSKGKKKVIIDYSHTADSLEQALISIRHLVKETQPVVTVFGCGGDRDKTKRPVMGSIAEKYSDKVIVTSDNPRTENPSEIIEDIRKGMKSENYTVIEDREEAIKNSILESDDDAVVLIAGKGHENYQEINGVKHHFSDIETAKKYLSEIN